MTAPVASPAPVAEEAPLPPLSPDAEIKDQIARATEVTKRAERKAEKAAAKPAPKGKAAKVAAPVEPVEEVPDTEPAPPPEEDGPPMAPPSAALLVQARALAEKGDLDGALKLALGKDAAAFRLNDARWREWRKTQEKADARTAEREGKVQDAAKQLSQKYGRFVEAEKLFAADDYEGAFQKAFGLDLNSFQKKALSKFHGKNPEVEALRKQLEERDARDRQREEAFRQQQAQQAEAQQHQANRGVISQHLTASDDPQLAVLSKKPGFIRQVYTEFLDRTSKGEPASLLLVQACAEEIRDGLVGEFGDVFGPRDLSASGRPNPSGINSGSPYQAGKKPARPGAATAAPSSLSQRGASEASGPGRELTEQELLRKYTDLMKNAPA